MYHQYQTISRHKVFISYHHAGDQYYKDSFLRTYADALVDYSVRNGDIDDNLPTERIRQIIRDEFIRDATVTIVLVGAQTWKRKHVDWEIDSSLRDTKNNPRTGLLGIVLPTYQSLTSGWYDGSWKQWNQFYTDPQRSIVTPNNVPPRLWDNVQKGFAKMRPWPSSSSELMSWIHEAFKRRDQDPPPTLSRSTFGKNRSDDDKFWE
jgi:hypothetical protein